VGRRPRARLRDVHYGFARTLVVLRDLLALPLLVRGPEQTNALGGRWKAPSGVGRVGLVGSSVRSGGRPAGRSLS